MRTVGLINTKKPDKEKSKPAEKPDKANTEKAKE